MDINAQIAQQLAPQAQGPVAPQRMNYSWSQLNDMPALERSSIMNSMTDQYRPKTQAAPAVDPGNYTMAQLNEMPLLQRQRIIDSMSAYQRQQANDSMGPSSPELTQTPLAVRQAQINAAGGGPVLYGGQSLTPEGRAYKAAFTPTPQQLAQMQARPELAQRYQDATQAGRERVGQIGQQRRDRIAAQMAARARAMEGGGLKDALPMLGMMIPGAGALIGAYRMSQGQNRPGDYMKLAQMFL